MRSWRSVLAWLLVIPWAGWLSIRLAGIERGYPAVAFVAFTPWVVLFALAAGLVAALLRRWAPVAVAVLTLAALAAVIVPRATGSSDRARGPELRVMTVNTHLGRLSVERLVQMVRRERVDVLSLQELTPALVDALEAGGLGERLPHSLLRADGESMDTGIYSRRPLKRLPEPVEAPSDVTVATLSVRGAPRVELHSVHATAPTGRGETWAWLNALRRLPGAPPDAAVRVLAGDFNATLDHAHLRRLLDRGYRDAADVVGQGLRPTWQGLLTIDHVLVTEEIGVRSVKVIDLPGSDHDAVLAALSLPRSRG